MQVKIVKGISGFYYIHVVGAGIYECKAKGSFRNQKIKPLVGDNVEIAIDVYKRQQAECADARIFDAAWEKKADVVIADLPCSGLGVIGRKKDIKYKMTVEKEAELVALQREILKNAVRYVKPGGTLLYSKMCIRDSNLSDSHAVL